MRFGFTEEQEMIREMAARFAEREVTQQAGSLDEAERFDRYGYDKMAELALLDCHGRNRMEAPAQDSSALLLCLKNCPVSMHQ